ncbi:BREX-1 system adenine-specific DNA-methyltransferase PglX [Paenibacillus sp. CMM36]
MILKITKKKKIKALEAVRNSNVFYRYVTNLNSFSKITGNPIAYWVSDKIKSIFESNKNLGDVSKPRQGMKTLDNERFIKYWYEVECNKISFDSVDLESAKVSKRKWFPINHGGEFRKFYGNNEFVVNWENDGYEMKELAISKYNSVTRTITNIGFYYKEGLTWTAISSGTLSVRDFKQGFLFSNAGFCMFDCESKNYINALLNSKVSGKILEILSPTLNYNVRDIANIPYIYSNSSDRNEKIELLTNQCIEISKRDWDSFETSWDFRVNPIILYQQGTDLISQAYGAWKKSVDNDITCIKESQEEINKLFIEIYELTDEISPEISDEDISIRQAVKERDIRAFISYAVGCMLGRYSLDKEGVIFAGGKFDPEVYQTYPVDRDNILSVLPGSYFDDDIVSKLIEFVKVTFGESRLFENMEYIAEALSMKEGETSKEAIRRYFLAEFYKDHIQMYNKKPIYWLFTSGKQKAFNCLIYMHRYDKSTLSRIRTDYLHELQIRMDAEKKTLLDIINGDGTTKEIANAKKELKSLDLKIEELRAYDEKLHHMADMQIEIDLDEGVAVNYAKFDGLLAPIK